MSLIVAITQALEIEPDPIRPFIVGGIALAFFLVIGIVTWSYRDVANRHSDRVHPTVPNTPDSHFDH
jgi:hypothetical protein